jgi:hypothetical protein
MEIKRISLMTVPPLEALQYGDLRFQALDSVIPPLNLLSLAACIRKLGFQPSILDAYVYPSLKIGPAIGRDFWQDRSCEEESTRCGRPDLPRVR